MRIRIRATGAVMLEDEFRSWVKSRNGPTWDRTTPEILQVLGADPVFEGPQAQPTRYQISFQNGVVQINGKWYTKYDVVDMDEAGKAAVDAAQAKTVRDMRNQRLKETDWTQVLDAPVNQVAWAIYRQALRNVPGQEGFPWSVVWPEPPTS